MTRLERRNLAGALRRPLALGRIWPAAACVLLGACAAFGPPAIKTSRVFQGVDRQVLYERTVAALRASDLKVTATDPAKRMVTAVGSFDGRNWAECSQSKLFVEDSEHRHHLIAVPDKDRRVELQASVSEAPEGPTLTLAPAFTAEPVSPMATRPECRTTGALERQIFEAVAKG
jgi:hypothetical protein